MAGELFSGAYQGRRVLVTGHTGFVGSWAVRWLHRLGAEVVGVSRGQSRPPVPSPDAVTGFAASLEEAERLRCLVTDFQPELVLHLAGETLVSRGFAAPAATFRTNLLGAINVLDSALHCPQTTAVLVLSTPASGAAVTAPVGPYAASKHAVEAVAAGYAHPRTQQPVRQQPLRVGVVRPGVMIGGDWAPGRLVPDVVRAVNAGQPVELRSPEATRPWQHVLDGVSGLLASGSYALRAALPRLCYELGRPDGSPVEPTHTLVTALLAGLGVPQWPVEFGDAGADRLELGCAAATKDLGWLPTWDAATAVGAAAGWYRAARDDPGSIADVTDRQIDAYVADAVRSAIPWATAGRPASPS